MSPLSDLRGVVLVLSSAYVATLPAQQSWVPVHLAGVTGVGIAEAPWSPTVLRPFPFGASSLRMFGGDTFRRRADVLPLALEGAQAATFDAGRQRVVVYSLYGGASTVCVFDGARWSVLPTTNAPSPRLQPAFAYDLVHDRVVLFGGGPQGSQVQLADTWLLDGDVWTQVAGAAPTPRRSGRLAPAIVQGSLQLLLFGGLAQFGVPVQLLDDTWAFDGAAWTQLYPSSVPSPRMGGAMAFDPSSSTTLFYGGQSGPLLEPVGDAWQWGGTDWLAVAAPTVPPLSEPSLLRDGARLVLVGRDAGQNAVHAHAWQGAWLPLANGPRDVFAASLALDAATGEIVRFGGRDGGDPQPHDETWLWRDGWRLAAPTAVPPGRERAALAWHAPSGRAVLFGGQAPGVWFGDTWLWNGLDWQPVAPGQSPSPRGQSACAYDPTRGTVVLFGGADGAQWFDDTWQWNGTVWAQVPTAVVPPARQGSLAFDTTRQVLALHVSSGSSAQSGTLWELHAGGWTQVSASAPAAGDLVYDPQIGALALFATIGTSSDYVAGVWVPRNQGRIGPVVCDATRGVVLAVGAEVYGSVFVPATTSVYGNGCGPAGEVTCSLDRAPAFDAPVTAWVRTLAANTPTFLFFGATPANVPFGGGCTVHIDQLLFSLAVLAAPSGWAAIDFVIPDLPGTIGLDVFAQALTLQPAGFGFSNGVALRLGR